MKGILGGLIVVCLILPCGAAVIHVPQDAATIIAGIESASDGDTVLVAPGSYSGDGNINIGFQGKSILVISESGPQNCIIDCRNNGRGFYFALGETSEAVLDGFTVRNGNISGYWPEGYGGAVLISEADPKIRNCVFEYNLAYFGGAIAISQSEAVIENCIIRNNTA
ncbi:hypothetical protein JW979_13980, partial [bacterium]|nr:hypothetical protein [candidate division CSSED10-310 bacterium]